MQKSTFLTWSIALAATVLMQNASAQHSGVAPRFSEVNGTALEPTNYHKDYVKRFFINEPSTVSGSKIYSIANSGRGATGDWGGSINAVWHNAEVVAAKDSLACSALSNASAINNNWALVYRGDCEFGRKAFMAEQAGAKGVIIVNNVSGGPVGMGPGAQGNQVTIPVLMISKEDGDAINTVLNDGVTVTLSIAPWGVGVANDLGFLSSGGALWNSYAIPRKQVASGNGNPEAFKAITGAFIGNFGSNDQTNVIIKNRITFTPDGSSATLLKEDSILIQSFDAIDSIMYGFTDDLTDFHASGKGRLDANYTLTYDQTDDLPGDNVWSASSYVTDTIYSRGRYDLERGRPVVTSSYGFTNGEPFLWGPLYYFAKGGDALRWVQFSVSNGNANNPSLENAGEIMVYVYEWNNTDTMGRITGEDLTPVGVGTKQFRPGDSSGHVFRAYISDVVIPNKAFVTRDDTWYWVVVDVPGTWFLGVDGYLNYYPRNFFRRNNTVAPFYDFYGPVFAGTTSTLDASVVSGIPFESYFNGDSARYSQQLNGLVPAVALQLSSDTNYVSVDNVSEIYEELSLFPNPVTDVLTVKLGLATPASKVTFTVIDVMGRNVMRQEHHNVHQGQFTIPTNSLASGSYYLVINPGEGKVTARKFIVER